MPERILGFDYGTKKIGVAYGQVVTANCLPLKDIKAKDGIPNWQQLEQILREWEPDTLVIGLPLNMDGSESDISRRARKFSNRLHGRFGLPCHLVDERLSSAEAKQMMVDHQWQDKSLDCVAAALILETWFNAQ